MLEAKFRLSELVLAALERFLAASRTAAQPREPASPSAAASEGHKDAVMRFALFLRVRGCRAEASQTPVRPGACAICVTAGWILLKSRPLQRSAVLHAQIAASWRAKPMPWDHVQRLWSALIAGDASSSDRCCQALRFPSYLNKHLGFHLQQLQHDVVMSNPDTACLAACVQRVCLM